MLGRSAVVVVAACASCAPPEVALRLRFPTEETFLVAATAKIEIYGADDGEDLCALLSIGQPAGRAALQSTGVQDVCLFHDGVEVDPVPVGRTALFAEAADLSGTPILRGCATVDVAADEDVEIALDALPELPADPAPACASVEDKCVRKVSCS